MQATHTKNPFDHLGLDPILLRAVYGLGYEAPTPIQKEAIPAILTGRDAIGPAPPGSGTTAALLLPTLHRPLQQSPGRTPAPLLPPPAQLPAQIQAPPRRPTAPRRQSAMRSIPSPSTSRHPSSSVSSEERTCCPSSSSSARSDARTAWPGRSAKRVSTSRESTGTAARANGRPPSRDSEAGGTKS